MREDKVHYRAEEGNSGAQFARRKGREGTEGEDYNFRVPPRAGGTSGPISRGALVSCESRWQGWQRAGAAPP